MEEPTPGAGRPDAGPRAQAQGRLLVLAAAALWGTTGTAQALGPDGLDPLAVGAARMLVGGAALLAVAWAAGALGGARAWRPLPLLAAGVAMAAYQPLFFSGVRLAGVAAGTVVAIGSAPVLTGLLALALRGERPGAAWLLATPPAVAGAVLLAAPGGGGARPLGVLLAAGAGGAYSCYVLATKGLLDRHPPVGVTGATFALAALLLAPVLALAHPGSLADPGGLAVCLYLGLAATACAYLLFSRGLARLPAAEAATLSLAEPLTAATLGLVVLGEELPARGWPGLALLGGGLALLALGGLSPAGRPPARRLGPAPRRPRGRGRPPGRPP
ncbi:MAG TPA: EamA family transporter [Actinomycetes bacterium]|nr:EamA family transporter [Actinomycetes bacterium]